MLNYLHAITHRPSWGWDPVSVEHARVYAQEQWCSLDYGCLAHLEKHLGPLRGKRILDLGGGPGQYSVAFAERGADVVWHDVSRRYREIAERKAEERGVLISFSLGYLEEAARFISQPFDLVFCRICWRYCRSDLSFAKMIFSLVAEGGAGYIDTNVGLRAGLSGWQAFQYRLNARCGWKIGHPNPPPQRLHRYFSRFPCTTKDFGSSSTNDRLLFVKGLEGS